MKVVPEHLFSCIIITVGFYSKILFLNIYFKISIDAFDVLGDDIHNEL